MKSIRSLNKPPSHGVPFFPGIAHSQFIRFIVPSGFFVGTATKPKGWSFLQAFLSCASRLRAIPDIFKVPTGRVLRNVGWPPGGHPGACSIFWHVPEAFGATCSQQGLPGISQYEPCVAGDFNVYLSMSPSIYSPSSSSSSSLLRLLGAPEQRPRSHALCP